MFSIAFLHLVREAEVETFASCLPAGASVLEIGGGTGFQARALSERGFEVAAVDLPNSDYSAERVFPVVDYGGRTFPFADDSFDVVISSNVLEHIVDLPSIHREAERVLKPSGYCVHAMPSPSWRFWTSVSGVAELPRLWSGLLPQLFPRGLSLSAARSVLSAWLSLVRTTGAHVLPVRHGETGNAFTELWTFSRRHWVRHFRQNGFEVLAAEPMGLFYTGYMVRGARWSLASRRRAARWLGSACTLYKVRPLSKAGGRTGAADGAAEEVRSRTTSGSAPQVTEVHGPPAAEVSRHAAEARSKADRVGRTG